MMDNIRDPLIHIVRNAVDHGIEPLDQRVAAGKRVTANLSVSARQSGNQLEIVIRDDGRGLYPRALVAHAVEAPVAPAPAPRGTTPRPQLDPISPHPF